MQTVMVVSGASERFWNQTPFRSYLFNAFSLLLPSGEQFVIRAMEDAVTRLPEGAPLQEEVAQFVREDCFHFCGLQAPKQGVEENDSLGFSESREVGVAMVRTLRSVHDEEAGAGETAAFEQGFDTCFERGIVKRRELVEQGRDPCWIEEEDKQIEAAPEQPDVEPPERSHLRHQPQHGEEHGRSDHQAECCLLELVGEKQS